MKKKATIVFLIFIFSTALNIAFAQAPTTGELAVTVINDQQTAISAAKIQIEGPQGAQYAETDNSGSYIFRLLPVGSYNILVTAEGYSPRTLDSLGVRLNDRTNCAVVLLPAISEEVNVTAPAIDVTQTSSNLQIPSEVLEHIPVGRSIGELANLSASVVADQGATGASPGKHNPSISGATGLENAYIIDGVNVADTGFGGIGAYSYRHASFGSGVTFSFIESMEVMSAGIGVEYGEATGGVLNVITKSGTNELNGSVFGYIAGNGLRSKFHFPVLENRSVHAVTALSEYDAGLEIGGPVIKDKLFFFAAYNPQDRSITKKPDPATALAILGERNINEVRNAYSGKISWNLNQNQNMIFSLFGDPGSASLGPQMPHPHNFNENPNYESELEFGSNTQVFRYNAIVGQQMTVEAQIARSATHYKETLPPQWDQHFFIDATSGNTAYQGGPGYYDKRDGESLQYQLKSTNFFNALGGHTFKAGISFDDVDYLGTNLFSGPSGVRFFDASGNEYAYDTGLAVVKFCADDLCNRKVYQVVQGFLDNSPNDTSSQLFSIFFEDSWQITPNFVVNAGLRADRQKLNGGGQPKTLPDGSIVHSRSYTFGLWDHLSPRIGASWDFTRKGKGSLYMSIGRIHRRIGSEFANKILSPLLEILGLYYDVQPGLTLNENLDPQYQTFDFGEPYSYVTGLDVLAGTKLPYQDEFVIGTQYEMKSGLVLGGRYLNRRLGRALEDFNDTPAEAFLAGRGAGLSFTAGNPGTNLNHLCPPEHPNCWVDPERKYDALELTVDGRLSSRWQLLGSYRLSHLRGNYEGQFNSATGLPGNATTQYDFPNNTEYTDAELQTICKDAPDFQVCVASLPPPMKDASQIRDLPTDSRHVFQTAATYLPMTNLNLGANLRIHSGLPRTLYHASAVYGWPGDVQAGTAGRTPWTWNLDLHADYTFALTHNLRGVAIVDVFNATNNQEAIAFDNYLENFGGKNSDFGKTVLFQEPRSVRLGFRLDF